MDIPLNSTRRNGVDFPVPNTNTILNYHTRPFGQTQQKLDGEALDAITYAGITELDKMIIQKGENTTFTSTGKGPEAGKFLLAGISIDISKPQEEEATPTFRQAKNILIGVQLAAHNEGFYEEATIVAREIVEGVEGVIARVDLVHKLRIADGAGIVQPVSVS